jgi:hypothetical protein
MDVIHERCAGIDISKARVKVCARSLGRVGGAIGRCARSRR